MRAGVDDERSPQSPRSPRVDRRRLLAELGGVLVPGAALLVLSAVGPEGAAGRFQGALAGMVVITAVGAFGTGSGHGHALRVAMARVVIAALLAGLVYGLRGLPSFAVGDALSLALLYGATGAAACGLAALGRVMGTPAVAAGAVAACVLWTAMAGLFWADPVAEHLDRTRRRPFRQAVLHVDPALALAYGAVGYDRLRSEEVYFDVPLASSLYDRPRAGTTGLTWWLAGFSAWGAALGLAALRDRRGGRRGAAAPPP